MDPITRELVDAEAALRAAWPDLRWARPMTYDGVTVLAGSRFLSVVREQNGSWTAFVSGSSRPTRECFFPAATPVDAARKAFESPAWTERRAA